jgi:hypothetical protein
MQTGCTRVQTLSVSVINCITSLMLLAPLPASAMRGRRRPVHSCGVRAIFAQVAAVGMRAVGHIHRQWLASASKGPARAVVQVSGQQAVLAEPRACEHSLLHCGLNYGSSWPSRRVLGDRRACARLSCFHAPPRAPCCVLRAHSTAITALSSRSARPSCARRTRQPQAALAAEPRAPATACCGGAPRAAACALRDRRSARGMRRRYNAAAN